MGWFSRVKKKVSSVAKRIFQSPKQTNQVKPSGPTSRSPLSPKKSAPLPGGISTSYSTAPAKSPTTSRAGPTREAAKKGKLSSGGGGGTKSLNIPPADIQPAEKAFDGTFKKFDEGSVLSKIYGEGGVFAQNVSDRFDTQLPGGGTVEGLAKGSAKTIAKKLGVKEMPGFVKEFLKPISKAGKKVKIKGPGAITTKTEDIIDTWLGKTVRQSPIVQELLKKSKQPSFHMTVLGATLAGAATVASLSLGGKNFGNFIGSEEASNAAGICIWMAQESDDMESYVACRELQKEALQFEAGLIPFDNVEKGLTEYKNIVLKVGEVMDHIMADRMLAIENGEGYEETSRRVQDRKLIMDKASTDYFNEQHRISKELDRQSDADFNAKERKLNLQHRKNLHKLEAEERKRVEEFWLNYAQMKFELEAQQRRSSWDEGGFSNLGFGLV